MRLQDRNSLRSILPFENLDRARRIRVTTARGANLKIAKHRGEKRASCYATFKSQ